MSVNLDQYEYIRFWALGQRIGPLRVMTLLQARGGFFGTSRIPGDRQEKFISMLSFGQWIQAMVRLIAGLLKLQICRVVVRIAELVFKLFYDFMKCFMVLGYLGEEFFFP